MTDGAALPADLIQTDTLGDDTAIVTATVNAARPVIFSAFTEPAVLVRWFWPQRFGTRLESDLRPGGGFAIHADGLPEGQSMGVTGVYQEVAAASRLTMSWQWTGESAVTHVAIELTDVDEGQTEVVVTHSANPSTSDRDDHLVGWADCLGRLVQEYGSRDRAD